MKQRAGCGSCDSTIGGDIGIPGKGITMNPRNLRRLAKKYPNDQIIQDAINKKLAEYTYKNQDEAV